MHCKDTILRTQNNWPYSKLIPNSGRICKFLGDISYPIYITHYPLIYIYTAWVCNTHATITEGIPYMILVFVGAIALAYACLKLYDEPVRRRLTERFLKKSR